MLILVRNIFRGGAADFGLESGMGNPPIPANEAPPGFSKLILYTIGSTSLGRIRMIVRVVISRLTRVSALNFATGNVGRPREDL